MSDYLETPINDVLIDRESIILGYKIVREFSEKLCVTLQTEDYVIQSMPDVSPTRWHLAHTSWFFETFVLKSSSIDYKELDPVYNYLFNSYYVQVGERFSRPQRGLISRPGVQAVYDYRHYVDKYMLHLLETVNDEELEKLAPVIEIGLNHEQQHQELMLTDIKHVFSINPICPSFSAREPALQNGKIPEMKWLSFDEGIYNIGYNGNVFCYDNELPYHKKYLHAFNLGSRLITNGEYLKFIEDGGYKRPELWLSDGWAAVEANKWEAPFYWLTIKGERHIFTLNGLVKLIMNEPVCHVSFYEADAYARWAGARLPLEEEWEAAANDLIVDGNFVEDEYFHPAGLDADAVDSGLQQMYGDVWEWTGSPYIGYPGYRPPAGAIGEYNGKFMSGQMVLRGGSCATSRTHIRKTYRNFFPPSARWQFMGIRLAKHTD